MSVRNTVAFVKQDILKNIQNTTRNTTGELLKNLRKSIHPTTPADEDDDSSISDEPYEIVDPRRLRELIEDELLESSNVRHLQEALEPFSEIDFKSSRYIEGLLDRQQVKERRERKRKRRNLLNLKLTSSDSDHAPATPVSKQADEAKRKTTLFTNVGAQLKSGLNSVGKGVEKMTNQVGKMMDMVEKPITQALQHEIEEEEEDKQEREDHVQLLRNFKQEVSKTLIQEVYDHYPTFITTSKEIAIVDADLVELGKLWNEMKSSIISMNELKQVPLKAMVSFQTTDKQKDAEPSADITLSSLVQQIKSMMPEFIELIHSQKWAACIKIYQQGNVLVEKCFMALDRSQYDQKLNKEAMKQLQNSVYDTITVFREHVQKLSNALLMELRKPHQLLQTSILEENMTTPQVQLESNKDDNNPEIQFHRVKLLIDYLVNDLNMAEVAASTFLESRSALLQETMDEMSVRSEGDPLIFTKYLARLYFKDTICATNDHFRVLFKEQQLPLLTKWVLSQIETFCKLMHANVFRMEETYGFEMISRAASISLKYANKLSAKGIHMTYLVQNYFVRDLENAARNHTLQKMDLLEKLVMKESWSGSVRPLALSVPNRAVPAKKSKTPLSPMDNNMFLCDSGVKLFDIITQYLGLIEPIASNEFYKTGVNCLVKLIEEYLIMTFTVASNSYLNDTQFFHLLCNVNSIVNILMPQLLDVLQVVFNNRELIEVQRSIGKISPLESKLISVYCGLRAKVIVQNRMQFHSQFYPKKVRAESEVNVSLNFKQLTQHVAKLYTTLTTGEIGQYLSKKDLIIPELIERILDIVEDEENGEFWHRLYARKHAQEEEDQEQESEDGESAPTPPAAPPAVEEFSQWEISTVLLDLKFLQQVCYNVMYVVFAFFFTTIIIGLNAHASALIS